MPYIKQESRNQFKHILEEADKLVLDEGELNYLITKILMGQIRGDINYYQYSRIIGALECAKLEFARRFGEYEDKKCKDNGDVYPIMDKRYMMGESK